MSKAIKTNSSGMVSIPNPVIFSLKRSYAARNQRTRPMLCLSWLFLSLVFDLKCINVRRQTIFIYCPLRLSKKLATLIRHLKHNFLGFFQIKSAYVTKTTKKREESRFVYV
jgi:hypothetical protein